MIASPLLSQLERAKNTLEDALIAHCGAVVTYAEAKRTSELAAAQKLCAGLEGANKEQREARLRLELEEEHDAVASAEDVLTEAKTALEVARLEWELVRYRARLVEGAQLQLAA